MLLGGKSHDSAPRKELLCHLLLLTSPNAGRLEPPSKGWGAWPGGGSARCQERKDQEQPRPDGKDQKALLASSLHCLRVLHCTQTYKDNMKFETGSSPKLTNIKKLTSCRGAGNSQHLQGR